MSDIIKNEESKVNSLTILSEEKRELIKNSLPYTVIPYMPITTEFIENVVLNNVEYPLIESKLSQSVVEMKSRINQLATANYDYEKTILEIEELEMDIEDIENDDEMSDRRKENNIKKIELEKRNKMWLLSNTTQSMETTFNEFKNWKQAVDDCVESLQKMDPTIKSIDDIDFDRIRMGEIRIKIDMWKQQASQGAELTEAQRRLVDADIFQN